MIGAQHCQATPRTLFPPWWGYRAGTCAVPNPTKFFARSAGRSSLRHTPPHGGWLVSIRREAGAADPSQRQEKRLIPRDKRLIPGRQKLIPKKRLWNPGK